MPDNYIVGYNARSDKFQKKCFTKEKSKVDEICKTVLAMESKPLEKSKFIIDRFLTEPIHRASDKKYKAVDYGFEAGQNCIGCGLCERICPADNIKLIDKKPQWNHHCEYCLACIQRCPVQAINHNNKTQGRKRYLNPNVRFPNKTGRQNTSA
jgi:ferredoxin